MGSALNGKNLLLEVQIFFLYELIPTEKGGRKIVELLPRKVYRKNLKNWDT